MMLKIVASALRAFPRVNSSYDPEAQELIAAFDEHREEGSGAFAFKGQMVDMPHLTRARKIVERARRAGVL